MHSLSWCPFIIFNCLGALQQLLELPPCPHEPKYSKARIAVPPNQRNLTPVSVHTNTFDCYAFHIQINVTVVLLLFTLQMLAFYALHCWATTSHCWATRLLYLVAQWATTFQSNLASPDNGMPNMLEYKF